MEAVAGIAEGPDVSLFFYVGFIDDSEAYTDDEVCHNDLHSRHYDVQEG